MSVGKHIPRPEGGPTDAATVKECLIVRQEGSKNCLDAVGSDTLESGRANNISLGRPTKRLRFLTARNASDLDRFALDASSEVTFLPMEAIGEQGDLDLSLTRPFEEVKSGYSRFRDGDVVVAKITPCFENGKGALIRGTATGIGFGTTELHVLSPGPELDGRFLYYVTIDPRFRHLGEACMTGAAGQQRVPEDFVRDFRIPVLPLPQQRAITDYLDHETARIDALISAKERLLWLLVEKRKSIIATAVTCGLDPKVKLRKSGVPWLGQVPEHWQTVPLRYLVSFLSGGTPDKGNIEYWMDGTIPWVSPKDMKVEEIADAEDHITEAALDGSATRLVPVGSVLVVVRGMILAHTLPVAVTSGSVTINQDIKALVCGDRLLPEFLQLVLSGNSKYLLSLADSSAHGTRKMETEVLQQFELPVPGVEEQRAIVEHIARETAKLDAVRAATERTMILLKERRATLIAAAVTGQLDAGVAA